MNRFAYVFMFDTDDGLDYNDIFLVFKIDLTSRNGWLPKEAWEWIEKMKKEVATVYYL